MVSLAAGFQVVTTPPGTSVETGSPSAAAPVSPVWTGAGAPLLSRAYYSGRGGGVYRTK